MNMFEQMSIHRQYVQNASIFPQELHADIQSQFLPEMLSTMLQNLCSHIDSVSLEDVTQGLRTCFRVLSKIQMPVAYMDVEAGAQTEEMESQTLEEEGKNAQVRHFKVCANVVYVYIMFLMLTVSSYE